MAVYLGNIGNIEIQRRSLDAPLESVVNPSDVNASRDRFSFDFDEVEAIGGDSNETEEMEIDSDDFDFDAQDEDTTDLDNLSTALDNLALENACAEDTLDADLASLTEDAEGLDFLSGGDEISTKLDLARAYIDMDDKDGAREILEEIRQDGNEEQQKTAEELLNQL